MKLINAGKDSSVNIKGIVSITSPSSSPIRRAVSEAKDNGMAIDITKGKETKSVIFMESGHVILSIIKPETLRDRVNEL